MCDKDLKIKEKLLNLKRFEKKTIRGGGDDWAYDMMAEHKYGDYVRWSDILDIITEKEN